MSAGGARVHQRTCGHVKIVVPVKQVAALDDEFELLDDGVRRSTRTSCEWDLNEWDAFSLEAALQLREAAGGDGEVVAVTVGDEEAEEALLELPGARAPTARVRVWDEALAGADALAVARVLAAARRARGAGPGAVRRAVLRRGQRRHRDRAGRASSTCRTSRSSSSSSTTPAAARRRSSASSRAGWSRCCACALPALLTIQTGINEPRYATLRAIKQAREKPLEVDEPDELGLEPGALAAAAGSRRRGARGARTAARAPRCSRARRPRWRPGSSRSCGSG